MLHFGHALEQHLPGARQNAHRQLGRKFLAAHALGFAQRQIVGDRRNEFHAGHKMREFGKIGQDDRRIGAGIVLIAQLLQRRRDIAAQQHLEQIDHARAVGQTQHLPHVIGAHLARRMRDRLIEQRQRIAHRAFGRARDQRQRFRLDLDVFLVGDAGQMLAPEDRRRRAADRNAGSATAP